MVMSWMFGPAIRACKKTNTDTVCFLTGSNRHEAEVVRSVLVGRGIKAEVISDDCGAVDPALGLVQGAHLMVDEDEAERADALLDSFDDPKQDTALPDDAKVN